VYNYYIVRVELIFILLAYKLSVVDPKGGDGAIGTCSPNYIHFSSKEGYRANVRESMEEGKYSIPELKYWIRYCSLLLSFGYPLSGRIFSTSRWPCCTLINR
jgi:hypothetical protein